MKELLLPPPFLKQINKLKVNSWLVQPQGTLSLPLAEAKQGKNRAGSTHSLADLGHESPAHLWYFHALAKTELS